jgi:hypothetical protein
MNHHLQNRWRTPLIKRLIDKGKEVRKKKLNPVATRGQVNVNTLSSCVVLRRGKRFLTDGTLPTSPEVLNGVRPKPAYHTGF